ncbi:MAG: insulinase family protein [Clostridiales bacterium]|nr:insulinase family protein [Clostridiales bacterium]
MIKTRKLNCGTVMVLEHIPYVQSASIGIWARAGAVNETKKNAGVSHLIEHMMFKGTETRSAKQIAEDADKIGSQMNAFTTKEATCYYIKTLTTNIRESVDILMDMFLNSTYDNNELAKEKLVIIEEMKMIEDSPEDDIHDIICGQVFKGMPLAQPVIGTKGSVSGITRSIIKNYIENEYTKDSIVVSVAGRYDEEELVGMFEGMFDRLKGGKTVPAHGETPHSPTYRVKVKDIEQTHICMGIRGVKIEDERFYALMVLNNILGGSMSSRLFQSIREEKGLAYSVYSASSSFVDDGIFSIYAAVSHEKAADAISAIREELLKLKKEGVAADELSAAKEQLKGGYIFGQENVSGRMFANGKNMALLGRVYLPEEVIAGIDKVTNSGLEDASGFINDFSKYSATIITNRKADLKKWML